MYRSRRHKVYSFILFRKAIWPRRQRARSVGLMEACHRELQAPKDGAPMTGHFSGLLRETDVVVPSGRRHSYGTTTGV